ncbi:MAG: DNA repair protein RecO C-terminal domain-containing protein [Muribaculaceae bacterium]|nr:DNA repair protein RecO C-terminal domain-containing protein [Muribaculaceae bacterium]
MALERITGIVIDFTKHSDRHNVVTLFTRERGRVSLLSQAGNGKTARIRNASLMPLSVISADINFSATRELQFLGQFSRPLLWKDIYFNPVKSAIALFISEFLNIYLRQSPPDARLFDYLTRTIGRLDRAVEGIPNFHLAFLIEFLNYAGIYPDLTEWRPDAWFDLQGGVMTIFPPAHRNYIEPSNVGILPLLARMNLRTSRVFRFNGTQRRQLLNTLLRYYSLHFPGMGSMKSPEVLGEVFS